MTQKDVKGSQEQQMVKGAAWSTVGNFLSRFLGAAYIIPWYQWMGAAKEQANALFGMGYEVYALFLLISTVGLNVAISKQVAKYNTMGKPEMTFYLIRQILLVMLGVGVVFAGLLFFGAPLYASLSGGGQDLVSVLRSLTLAVLVYPAMSILRGVFQGYNNLKPFALSQIAEQMIRVIWMLLTAFFIMKMGSGDYVSAVRQSTFAAVIGMVASIAVLIYFLWQEGLLSKIFHAHRQAESIDTIAILWDTLKEAVPFVVTGAAVQVFRMIDQMTFINSMTWFTTYSNKDLQVLFAYMSSNPSKLTMILVAMAASVGGVGIPLLTENTIKNDRKASARLILTNIQLLLLFILPTILGGIILAEPIYTIFYGASDPIAISLFKASLFQTIFLAFYTVFSPMLLALFENKKAIKYFIHGLMVKLLLQIPTIWLFGAYGPIISTGIALMVPIALSYRQMYRLIRFNRKVVQKSSLLMVVMTVIMGLAVGLMTLLLSLVLNPASRFQSLVYLIIVGAVGVAVYGAMALRLRLLDKLIGTKADSLRRKFHIS